MIGDPLHLSRRQVLAGLASLPVAACAGAADSPGSTPAPGPTMPVVALPASATPLPSLHTLAQRSGRRFGRVIAYYPGPRLGGTVQDPA